LEEIEMFSYVWPMALVVLSNTAYQICAKSVPGGMNPFASLTVTYLVGALASGLFYVALGDGGNILQEYTKLNWAPFVLGLVIVGLEVGWIYAYKAGWPVSTAFIFQSAILAGFLLMVGRMLYQEPVTLNKIIGIIICLIGLYFLSRQ
jgi:drug/metabolite transporter (DMT)-like permease